MLDRPIGNAHGPGRRDPPARDQARPRRAPLPGGADRARRAPRPAGLREGGRLAEVQGLPGLHREPPAHAGRRPARRLARARTARRRASASRTRTSCSATSRMAASGAPPAPEELYFKHANRAYLDERQGDGADRQGRPDRAADLCRAAAEIPPRRRGPWREAAARGAARARRAPTATRCPSGTRRSNSSSTTPSPSRSPPSRSGRWRCTIPGARRTPGCGRSTARTSSTCRARAHELGPRAGRLGLGGKPQRPREGAAALMEGVNPTPSGPGTPSASAPAPGCSRPTAPRRSAASCSTT
jgi:hypothetical protein